MDNYICKNLEDILIAIDEIDNFFVSIPKTYNQFTDSVLLQRAVERSIEIIGEAMNRILKLDSEIQITNARKIVDTRNYIIHGYDSLLPDMLWSIVINHLPILKEEIKQLLKK